MSFEDIPEDKEKSYPCPNCTKGNITENGYGEWECDTCDFLYNGESDD